MSGWTLGPVNPAFARFYECPPEVMTPLQVRRTMDEHKGQTLAMKTYGPPLWAELHLRMLALAPGTDDSAWLADFGGHVPCGICRNHWLDMVRRTPPDWADPFSWSVELHNEIRRRLDQPEMLAVSARLHWSRIAGATPLTGT